MTLSLLYIEKELSLIVQQLLIESGDEHSHRKITLELSLQRHLGIDSLGRAELFSRIEKKFGVTLSDKTMAQAETLADIAQALLIAKPAQLSAPRDFINHIATQEINPQDAKTLIDVLLSYAEQNPDRPHIYFQDDKGNEETITYGNLLKHSQRIAFALIARGLKRGDKVAIMQPSHPNFFYTFFGILLAGAVPVPIYPPVRLNHLESYAKQESSILTNAEVSILVTFQEAETLSRLLKGFVPSLKDVITVDNLLKSQNVTTPFITPGEDNPALIQYTSGSTSLPKGVLLTHGNLLANIRAYGEAIQVKPSDIVVSWLPLYHDLGLIGMWLGSLYFGTPLVLMSPLTFLNRPERWLWAIHYHRATITAGPNFAYELCVRKIKPASIEGLDLSSVRLTVNGAEPIQRKTLEHFTEKFSSYGFNPTAMFPVYGLAESSVGLTTSPLNRLPRVDIVERKSFEENHLATPAEGKKNNLEFIGCGFPLPGHEIRIVDEENRVLPERHVGQLQFRGPSSMQGYYNNREATDKITHHGWIDTGDLGYLADKELFITGRKKDVIIKAGRNLYPAEIETLVGAVKEVRQGCVIAFGVTDDERGTEQLIVVAETRDKNPKDRNSIIENISENILSALDIAPDHVILIAPQTIPKTSSGKLQRSQCKTLYLQGKLSKRRLPVWLQIGKLALYSAWNKIQFSLELVGKCLYTAYMGLMVVLTIIPVYFSLFFISEKNACSLFKAWSKLITYIGFSPIKCRGKKHLHNINSAIYVANHASFLDPIILAAVLPPQIRFVSKKENFNVPVLRHFLKKLGHLEVDRTDFAKSLEDTKKMQSILEQGHSLLIFAEGTFTLASGLRPFKMGAFKLAAETGAPLIPVAIQGTREALRDKSFLMSPNKIKVTLCKPVFAKSTDWQDITHLKNQVRNEIANYCGEPTLDYILPGPPPDNYIPLT